MRGSSGSGSDGVGRGGEVEDIPGSLRSSKVGGGRSKKSAALGRVGAGRSGWRVGGTALDEVVVVVDIRGGITAGVLAGGEGCRVSGTSKDGVDMMFAMSEMFATGIEEPTHERLIGFRRRGKTRWRGSKGRHGVLGIR